jgi:large subunit ribosomal protein L20
MPRATNAPAAHRRHKSRLKLAKGFRGARSKLFRQATESVDRAQAMAYVHRKQKKRNFRRLWTVRINAACRMNGIRYSRFIEGLTKAGIRLNRKMLSEIAVYDEAGFSKLVETAKSKLA